jgi:hypothetical protein
VSAFDQHTREVRRLLAFTAGFGLLAGLSYLVPGTEEVRPWMVGEPVPLVHLALGEREVVEAAPGVLVSRPTGEDRLESSPIDSGTPADAASAEAVAQAPAAAPPAAPPADAPAPAEGSPAPEAVAAAAPEAPAGVPLAADAEPAGALAAMAPPAAEAVEAAGTPVRRRGTVRTPGAGALQNRGAARGTPLEIPDGALDRYFASLSRAEAGEPGHITRALHFGDSTIASDGITKTVRKRLQGHYGDGGPGFLAVQVDRRWAVRPGVLRDTSGSWKTLTITFGGADMAYYGLGGTVSTARGPSKSVLGGLKVEGERQPLQTFDVFFQVQPEGGTLSLATDSGASKTFQTAAAAHGDVFHRMSAEGAKTLTVATGEDGPVTLYGVALETAGPGITWETLGVAGAGSGSHFRQGKNHIARQVGRRNPDLIVWQLGGNEVGLPVLKAGDGTKYKERYKKALKKVLAGAPTASCLVVTPLDQAERYRGQVRSKPNLTRMVNLQRDAAFELGCAFWDARAAMGGSGAFARWVEAKPALAWSDLEHLTGRGLNLIGHSLADAIEAAYIDWKARNPALVGAPALAQAGE